MTAEPPRIRDDRRDPDLTRIKERLATVEKDTAKLDQLVNGMHYAMFGIPEDKTSNGLVGTMADLKNDMHSLSTSLNRILTAVIIGIGIDGIARFSFHA